MSVFEGIIGHRPIRELLDREAEQPAHAYLFVGPGSLGKAAVARRFAALLLCGDDPGCFKRTTANLHPDLTIVEPDGRTVLSVDRARETAAKAVLAPVEASRKVFLFEEAGAMNEEAANALLKSLEEPTPTTVFILVTESVEDLPATVVSRSRTIGFGRVADEEIVAGLVAEGVAEEQAAQATAASGGRPGLARMLATRPEAADFRAAWLSVPERLTTRPGDAIRLAQEMVAAVEPMLGGLDERQQAEVDAVDGGDSRALKERHDRERRRAAAALHLGGLEILATWYRDAAVASFGGPVRNRDVSGTALAGFGVSDAVSRAQRVLRTADALKVNQRAELAFSALFAELGSSA